MGEYENTSVTMDNFGLLPSISKYLSQNTEESKDNFRYFYKFMADNEVYLVAKDHSRHQEFCPSDKLLMALMKANQKTVMDYDFTEMEAESEKELRERDEIVKDIMEFKQVAHVDPI